MERLLNDAAKIDKSFDNMDMGYANIVKGINIIQKNMGIYGTTAKEASETIEGSLNATKAAWQNLLTGMADEEADFDTLVNNLVESAGIFAENIIPRVEVALGGVADLISKLAPIIIEKLPYLIDTIVPSLITTATNMVDSVVDILPSLFQTVINAIIKNAPLLMETGISLIGTLTNTILEMLPEIIKLGLDLIISLANGIAESLPELIPTIIDVILQIVDTLTDPKNLSNLLQAALFLITQLAWGLVNSIPALVDSVITIIEGIVTFLLDPANLSMLIQTALQLVLAIGLGLVQAIPKLITSVAKLVVNIADYFIKYDWASLGKNLVEGFKRGISNAWKNLKQWFRSLFGDLIYIAKKILGIASPSKVFKKLGGFTAEGFGIGWEDEFANVNKELEKSLAFENLDPNIGINASVKSVKSSMSGNSTSGGLLGGTVFSGLTININGAKYTDERELAEAIAERLQMMTERREAVYA